MMKLMRKLKRCEQRSRSAGTNISIYMGALVILIMGAAAEAGTSKDGLSVETGGLKINLQIASPEGMTLTFQRANYSRR